MEPAASIPLLKILNVSFPPRTTVVLVSSVFAEQTRRYKMYRDVHFVPCLRLICSCALHLHLLFLKGWRKISFQKSQIVLYSSDAVLLVSNKLCEILDKISHSLFLGEGQSYQTGKLNSVETRGCETIWTIFNCCTSVYNSWRRVLCVHKTSLLYGTTAILGSSGWTASIFLRGYAKMSDVFTLTSAWQDTLF